MATTDGPGWTTQGPLQGETDQLHGQREHPPTKTSGDSQYWISPAEGILGDEASGGAGLYKKDIKLTLVAGYMKILNRKTRKKGKGITERNK